MSGAGVGPVEIHIGPDVEEEKKLSPSSVPLFVRRTVFEEARKQNLVPASVTVDTIDVPAVLRSASRIRTYVNGVEEIYVPPTGCLHFRTV